jgi:hypothetical protein
MKSPLSVTSSFGMRRDGIARKYADAIHRRNHHLDKKGNVVIDFMWR